MVTQQEVFSWFKSLSGATRIELMCGLMSMCIPLEIRFFESVIQDMTKKYYNSFIEAELKANSIPELEMMCKSNLLSEKSNASEFEENEINGGGDEVATAATTNNNSNLNEQKTATFFNYPSRSKLIITLCLLQPTNHTCSNITFNLIRQQLMAQKILDAVRNLYVPKNLPLNSLFSEIMLLFTMAIYHPAFSYEQRDLLTRQKEEVEATIELLNFKFPYLAGTPPPPSNAVMSASGQQQVQQTFYATNPNVSSHHQPPPQPHLTAVHTQPHPPTAPGNQAGHSYHQNSMTNKSHHIAGPAPPPPPPTIQQTTQFQIQYLQPGVQIANLAYTAPPGSNVSQSGAIISNMAMLKINSPQSTSPSPSISPSTVVGTTKMTTAQHVVGLQPMIFMNEANSGGGGGNTAPPIQFLKMANTAPTASGGHNVIVEDSKSSINTSSMANNSSSCYNCGNVGHLGVECTSAGGGGGDDNH